MKLLILVFLICLTISSLINSQSVGESEEELENEISLYKSVGSCQTAGLCCPGRDSSCVVQNAASNAIIEDLTDVSCYCDHSCLKIGDCCSDFAEFCGVQNCEVSEWGSWSSCDQTCGLGVMTRTREVITNPKNGGSPCPALTQKRGCKGTQCTPGLNRLKIEDTAILLPVNLITSRKYNSAYGGITKNIRLRYPKSAAEENAKTYCVEFSVVHATKTCKLLETYAQLDEGAQVCVICEKEAQRWYLGYKCPGSVIGIINDEDYENSRVSSSNVTRFYSLREPSCHGKWKHVKTGEHCSCSSGARYIFV